MPELPDWTILLSGPLAQKGPLLASLQRAGVDLSEKQELDSHWRRTCGDDDQTVGWVHCRHHDIDEIHRSNAPALEWTDADGNEWTAEGWHNQFGPAGLATLAGWRLRASWETPPCQVCDGLGQANHETGLGACLHCGGKGRTNKRPLSSEEALRAELDGLRADLEALKGKGA